MRPEFVGHTRERDAAKIYAGSRENRINAEIFALFTIPTGNVPRLFLHKKRGGGRRG